MREIIQEQLRGGPLGTNLRRRRTEDYEYLRKRAGWFDDDVQMKKYNDGVYDTFYKLYDDDTMNHDNNGVFSSSGGSKSSMIKAMAIKVTIVVVCLVLCILMFRVITRRLGEGGKKDKKKKKSSGSSRSRSKSRSRSRSKSRRREGDYDLLDEEEEKSRKSGKSGKSGRSSRSKSRSRRSRSRSRARSQSRSRKERASAAPPKEPILV